MAEEKKYTLKELQKKLTEKERIFCHEYIIDWNKARAARAAGYSEDNARQIGYDTYTKLYIQQYIEFIRHNLEEESGITKLRNLKELAKIAYSSISHLHDTWITFKDYEDIKMNNPDAIDAIESTETKTEQRAVYNPESDKKENIDIKYIKLKLYPKITAIIESNKMLGYYEAQKIEHSGAIDDLSGVSTEELIKRAKAVSELSQNKKNQSIDN